MSGSKYVMAGILAATMAVAVAGSLAAQDGATLVKQRQDLMGQMGKAYGPMIPIVKGKNPNVSDAVTSATTINTLAKKIVASFPAGTGRDAVPQTRAKPEVWSERTEFEAAAEKLVQETAKLIDAAKSNDINAFRAQFKAFGGACGGCHKGPKKEGGKFRFAKQ